MRSPTLLTAVLVISVFGIYIISTRTQYKACKPVSQVSSFVEHARSESKSTRTSTKGVKISKLSSLEEHARSESKMSSNQASASGLKTSQPSSLEEHAHFESKVTSTQTSTSGVQTRETISFSPAEDLFKLYDEVETFVMFIGYPRSSHSLVGAILDAHPEIIIPHEYDLLTHWDEYQSPTLKSKNLQKHVLFYDLHQLSMEQAMFGYRANNSLLNDNANVVYTYNIPGLWQGGFHKRIKVIGDKKGGKTSMELMNISRMSLLEEISQVVKVPMKFIHVVRNPFDNIATMMLRFTKSRETVREEGVKINNATELDKSIDLYFGMAAANQRVRERYGSAVIDIPGHETVLRPRETLQKLCDHLGVTCSEEYFEKCSRILYGVPSVTRNKVVWTAEQKANVTKMIKKFSFLKTYSFDEYPK